MVAHGLAGLQPNRDRPRAVVGREHCGSIVPPGASSSVRFQLCTGANLSRRSAARRRRVRTLAVVPPAVDSLTLGPLSTNCYVVRADRAAEEAVVVDPSGAASEIRLALASLGARCVAILVTHGHFDHMLGLADLAEGTGAPVYAPAAERALLEDPAAVRAAGDHAPTVDARHLLEGGEGLELAGVGIDVIAVPGHSPAHLAYAIEGRAVGRRPLRRVGRAHRSPRRGLADAPRFDPLAARALPPDRRPPGARGVDDPGQSSPQPVSRRAARRGEAGGVTERVRIERPRGTHDVVPAEMRHWGRVTGEIERLCGIYGYRRILTPVFEDTALFARTSGAGSDVVQKEMYTFTDRSDRSLTLRPEGTAPICRAYVEHGMHREPQPVKLFTIAPMYRYGAPGRGRYREHGRRRSRRSARTIPRSTPS